MKKVDVSFVCDICEAPLHEKFVGTNSSGEKYFNLLEYNTIRISRGQKIVFAISNEIEYNKDQKELCPKCRLELLREVVRHLEAELKEEAKE